MNNKNKNEIIGPWQLVFSRFVKDKIALVGFMILLFVFLFVIFGPIFTPHQINTIDITKRYNAPTPQHWFGTDMLGQDILTRMLHGGRISLSLSLLSACVTLFFGTTVGILAGFKDGWMDHLFMRVTEYIQVIPLLPLLIAFSAIFGFNLSPIMRLSLTMIAYGVLSFPSLAKIVRAQVIQLNSEEFILAAQLLGISFTTIVFKHYIPNLFGIIVASLSSIIANAILLELTLSFVGLGFPPPTPTWGNMIPNIRGANSIVSADYWVWFFPVGLISLTIISLNLLGEGLRQALDPKGDGIS
jgi:peptide/nickel transport system permease protein